jgi:murein DD-endopeptidase MepM/ murein hydrolase activator NlpD
MPPPPTRAYATALPVRPRRKAPVLRIALLGLLAWFCYQQFTTGWLSRFWDRRAEQTATVPVVATPKPDTTWKGWCQEQSGQAFDLSKELAQCSWAFANRDEMLRAFQDEAPSIVHRLRYAADRVLIGYPLQVHWVAPHGNFRYPRLLDLQTPSASLRLVGIPVDTVPWIHWLDAASGCAFPGTCPHDPLEGGAVPIPADFDFEGREYLLVRDLFRGIGESPVFPVLPGRVISISKEASGFTVELDHGNNLYSRASGLASIFNGVEEGSRMDSKTPVGRLSAQDTASFHLEILRNGKFVRWQDYWNETHPVDAGHFATFRNALGY